jgi:macrolide transport system ATP-binding/permease protein
MALGAERAGVTALVMRGAMSQTALGLFIGVPTALAGMRFVEALAVSASNRILNGSG